MTYPINEMPAPDGRLRQDLDAWHLPAIDLPGAKKRPESRPKPPLR